MRLNPDSLTETGRICGAVGWQRHSRAKDSSSSGKGYYIADEKLTTAHGESVQQDRRPQEFVEEINSSRVLQ